MAYRRCALAAATFALTALAILLPSFPRGESTVALPVPGCESGCDRAFSFELAEDARFEGLKTAGRQNILAFWSRGELQATRQVAAADGTPYDEIAAAACESDGRASRCSIAFGESGSSVASVRLSQEDGIVVSSVTEHGPAPA